MATLAADISARTPRGWSLKQIVLALGWVMLVAFSLHYLGKNALRYVLDFSPEGFRYLWPQRNWLLLHIGGAAFTVLLGPLQFVTVLRTRFPRVHRWTGRAYLVGLLIGFVGAVHLTMTTELGWTVAVALAVLAGAWIVTAAMAFAAIRVRNIAMHREWMIRNYLLTCAFITFRFITNLPGVFEMGTVSEIFTNFGWLSWVVPMAVYEVVRQLPRLRRAC
jgi:hypothetical protein